MFMGRVVRPGVDPQWTRDDRLFALAWQAEQAEKCSGCGRRWGETTDPESVEDYEVTTVTCHACAERDRARERLSGDEHAVVHGRYMLVDRRSDA